MLQICIFYPIAKNPNPTNILRKNAYDQEF